MTDAEIKSKIEEIHQRLKRAESWFEVHCNNREYREQQTWNKAFRKFFELIEEKRELDKILADRQLELF